jgi:hypothetical protein
VLNVTAGSFAFTLTKRERPDQTNTDTTVIGRLTTRNKRDTPAPRIDKLTAPTPVSFPDKIT